MIRALVVADSGTAMAVITAALAPLPRVELTAYASGRAPLEAVVRSVDPDVVLIDEMRARDRAVERIAEIRGAGLAVAVVGLAEQPDGAWMAQALFAGATAVVPRGVAPATLELVITEALEPRSPSPMGHVSHRTAA